MMSVVLTGEDTVIQCTANTGTELSYIYYIISTAVHLERLQILRMAPSFVQVSAIKFICTGNKPKL